MKFPIGIQDFEKIRTDGYVYADKTRQIYDLADNGSYYFLSRPRRFGKSLLISTMEAYFSGKKELFSGLAIEKLERKWEKYPILHLDLNTRRYENIDSLKSELNKHLEIWEKDYGDDFKERALEERFFHIVEKAYTKTGRRVVILVDEYDKPMLQAMGNEALQNEYRNTLKAFYSVLKTQDRYIKFAFLTGVTKFSKISVFSDLNNLQDISMDHRYADICGMTDGEIHLYFDDAVHQLADANHLTVAETYSKLKEMYDGYHFLNEGPGLYNPFSLLNTLAKNRFGDYWFETGTPSFLVKLLKETNYKLDNLGKEELTADMLNSIDSYQKNPIPIIYQSGYLTIKGYDEEFRLFRLGFPNKEVENGFVNYLLPNYLPNDESVTEFSASHFIRDLRIGNVESFMERLQTLFEDGDYQVMGKMELYFQNTMYVIFKVLGLYVEVERKTARGRIDMVIKTGNYIYVIETKLDGTADEAIKQIKDKGYAEPYKKDGRTVMLIGINFSSATKGIDGWNVEEF